MILSDKIFRVKIGLYYLYILNMNEINSFMIE
jgi:hypothetical protein